MPVIVASISGTRQLERRLGRVVVRRWHDKMVALEMPDLLDFEFRMAYDTQTQTIRMVLSVRHRYADNHLGWTLVRDINALVTSDDRHLMDIIQHEIDNALERLENELKHDLVALALQTLDEDRVDQFDAVRRVDPPPELTHNQYSVVESVREFRRGLGDSLQIEGVWPEYQRNRDTEQRRMHEQELSRSRQRGAAFRSAIDTGHLGIRSQEELQSRVAEIVERVVNGTIVAPADRQRTEQYMRANVEAALRSEFGDAIASVDVSIQHPQSGHANVNVQFVAPFDQITISLGAGNDV